MSRLLSPILAYHVATRRAYLFPGQTVAAEWLVKAGRCKKASTARSNIITASDWPRNSSGNSTRTFHGFVWVRGDKCSPPELLIAKLERRLRVWALIDADWSGRTDADLLRALSAAGVTDPAHVPTSRTPLASGIRLMNGTP